MIHRMFLIKKIKGNVENYGKLENSGFGVVENEKMKGIMINK